MAHNTLAYDFPLRKDFMAQVVVPRDLTVAEAKRLARFLESIPMPSDDSEEPPEPKVQVHCSSCGASAEPDDSQCSKCGGALVDAPACN